MGGEGEERKDLAVSWSNINIGAKESSLSQPRLICLASHRARGLGKWKAKVERVNQA